MPGLGFDACIQNYEMRFALVTRI